MSEDEKSQWVVQYIDGDGKDDWQMIKNSHRKYFQSELDAKIFAREHFFPKKPFYWQPSVWKEIEVTYTLTSWERV